MNQKNKPRNWWPLGALALLVGGGLLFVQGYRKGKAFHENTYQRKLKDQEDEAGKNWARDRQWLAHVHRALKDNLNRWDELAEAETRRAFDEIATRSLRTEKGRAIERTLQAVAAMRKSRASVLAAIPTDSRPALRLRDAELEILAYTGKELMED